MPCAVCGPAWAEYKKVRDAALAEYKKVRDAAWVEYEKVRDAAWVEYEKVRQQHPDHEPRKKLDGED